MMDKLKYIRSKRYNEIIVFPPTRVHSEFSKFEPISAGFCYINASEKKVVCYGMSVSLGLKSLPDDTEIATKQFFNNY